MNGLESPPNAFDSKNSWSRAFTLLEPFGLEVIIGSEGVDPSLVVTGMEFEGIKVTESFPTLVVGARFLPATRSREIALDSSLKSTESTLGGGWQYNNFALT